MRSVSEIYSEAVAVRNNYLQLTELNSGRSNSKLSMLNLLTYVAAVCIHTYEAVLDAFQVRIAKAVSGRINGTPEWYAAMARKFQYNSVTMAGDELVFDEEAMKLAYSPVDPRHRIIQKAAYETNSNNGRLTLKVCKANADSDEAEKGSPFSPLTPYELTAFRRYMERIKFVGAHIQSVSLPGDILRVGNGVASPIFYDDSYVNADQALQNIRKSLVEFARGLEFNDMLYYQAVMDVVRKSDYIMEVAGLDVTVASYDEQEQAYGRPTLVSGRTRLASGYLRLTDERGESVVTADDLVLVPFSQIDTYFDSLIQTASDA